MSTVSPIETSIEATHCWNSKPHEDKYLEIDPIID